MSLTDDERHAWDELERSLTNEPPQAPDLAPQKNLWVLAVPPEVLRVLFTGLIFIVGGAIFLMGVLTLVPLLWMIGSVILCVGLNRHRRHAHAEHHLGVHHFTRS